MWGEKLLELCLLLCRPLEHRFEVVELLSGFVGDRSVKVRGEMTDDVDGTALANVTILREDHGDKRPQTEVLDGATHRNVAELDQKVIAVLADDRRRRLDGCETIKDLWHAIKDLVYKDAALVIREDHLEQLAGALVESVGAFDVPLFLEHLGKVGACCSPFVGECEERKDRVFDAFIDVNRCQ